jgi:lysyl oxidase
VSLIASLIGTALLFASTAVFAAPPEPDLTVEIRDISMDYGANVFPGDLSEGCAKSTTGVDLVRFGVRTTNRGSAPLILGDPGCPPCTLDPGAICQNPLFHCSPAGGHNHPHYTNYARYELIDDDDQVVATGGKLGFCLLDSDCPQGIRPQYTCTFQGLTPGCSDYYSPDLGCQYIDVTDVPNGRYRIRVTLDPLGQIEEQNESNDVAIEPILIARGATPQPDTKLPGKLASYSGSDGFEFVARGRGFQMPDPLHDPTGAGGELRLTPIDLFGEAVIQLPAAGWTALGNPPGSRGYRFDGRALADPLARTCSVSIRPTMVRVRCAASPLIDLPQPLTGRLRVSISIADGKRYCATFGGETVENDASWVKLRNAPRVPCD